MGDVAGSWVEGRPAPRMPGPGLEIERPKGAEAEDSLDLGLHVMSDKGDSAANCGRTTGPRGLRLLAWRKGSKTLAPHLLYKVQERLLPKPDHQLSSQPLFTALLQG